MQNILTFTSAQSFFNISLDWLNILVYHRVYGYWHYAHCWLHPQQLVLCTSLPLRYIPYCTPIEVGTLYFPPPQVHSLLYPQQLVLCTFLPTGTFLTVPLAVGTQYFTSPQVSSLLYPQQLVLCTSLSSISHFVCF